MVEHAETIHELRCRGMSIMSFQAIPMGAPDWCDLYIQQTPDLGANEWICPFAKQHFIPHQQQLQPDKACNLQHAWDVLKVEVIGGLWAPPYTLQSTSGKQDGGP